MATKRAEIGAATTIAVAEKGFSESALRTARHHNIELRRLEDITDQAEVRAWLDDVRIDVELLHYKLLGITPVAISGELIHLEALTASARKTLTTNALDGTGLIHDELKAPVTLRSLIDGVDAQDVTVGQPPVRKEMTATFNPGTAYITTSGGSVPLSSVILVADFTRRIQTVSLPNAFEYSSTGSGILQAAEATIDLGGTNALVVQYSRTPP